MIVYLFVVLALFIADSNGNRRNLRGESIITNKRKRRDISLNAKLFSSNRKERTTIMQFTNNISNATCVRRAPESFGEKLRNFGKNKSDNTSFQTTQPNNTQSGKNPEEDTRQNLNDSMLRNIITSNRGLYAPIVL
jgi:hypothetical protein